LTLIAFFYDCAHDKTNSHHKAKKKEKKQW